MLARRFVNDGCEHADFRVYIGSGAVCLVA